MPNKSKKGFDVDKHSEKPIDKRGFPKLQETGVPGAPNIGTPKWIKAAVNSAEGRSEFNSSEHRTRGHQAGTGGIRGGLFGESEKIRGGQATRVVKDDDADK